MSNRVTWDDIRADLISLVPQVRREPDPEFDPEPGQAKPVPEGWLFYTTVVVSSFGFVGLLLLAARLHLI